jgi:hypothetical protein
VSQIWGMFRDPSALLSCVRECAKEARVSVFLPNLTPSTRDQVLLLGPLTRFLSPYPFLDVTRHLRRLGMDSQTASCYADGLSKGWCVVCIDGLPRRARWNHYPLSNAAILP